VIRSGGSRASKTFFAFTIAKGNHAAGVALQFSASPKAAGQHTVACAARNDAPLEKPDRVNSIPVKKPEPAKKPDFEKSLARLEEVVRRLESPQLSLDDAMKLFEEGVALSRECQKQLEDAEGRVEILLKKADGNLVAEPFDPERESES
jgi:exodeoxyribonuclease VII small subunit